jgi:hypothetical protein
MGSLSALSSLSRSYSDEVCVRPNLESKSSVLLFDAGVVGEAGMLTLDILGLVATSTGLSLSLEERLEGSSTAGSE